MREICTSGSVGGEGGNILTYPATSELCHAIQRLLGLVKNSTQPTVLARADEVIE